MTGSHGCPVAGCPQVVPDWLLLCKPHWLAVPRPLRTAVWRAYQSGRGVGSPELARAQAAAIAAAERATA